MGGRSALISAHRIFSRNLNTAVRSQPLIEEIRQHRVKLFDEEVQRQQQLVGRIEKIEVKYEGLPESATLIMNKSVSTPYNCAQHLGDMLLQRSVLAEVNGELWDMHRPLEEDSVLKLLHFKMDDPQHLNQVNRAFWRSCSFLLGAAMENAFKEDIPLVLHSFPSPNLKTGSFVYDIELGLQDWNPNGEETRQLSAAVIKMCLNNLKIQRLEIDAKIASHMFAHNSHKSEQIPSIAEQHASKITLYRVGDFIDISRGPMISNTSFLGRCSITAVHKLQATKLGGLYRFQGVAIPNDFYVNHFAYTILEERSKKLNSARVPEVPV
uniref:Large ribosomal subunit protein mL39 n=1 Tax=Lynceus sp. MCZ IZ 141354 TaxID=1930659 RepID=A0A9N6ZFN3_9CRUS|nr:EOG090X0A3R [Lynceus sp. MCZ IZ 141354]